jgi:hypothetical protein
MGPAIILLLAAAVAVIGGCASPAKFQPATGAENLPPYEGEVKILENLPAPNQYKRVGVVTVEGVLLTKEEEMVAAIKELAAEKGANAVVMQSPVKVSRNQDGGTKKRLAAWAIHLNR